MKYLNYTEQNNLAQSIMGKISSFRVKKIAVFASSLFLFRIEKILFFL